MAGAGVVRLKVAMVVGDIGSTNELIPVGEELVERTHEVQWFVDPDPAAKAGTALVKAKIPFETRTMVPSDQFDVVVCGAAVTATKLLVGWTRSALTRKIPVIWYEDMWATASRDASARTIDPDVMLVIDRQAAEMVEHARPKMKKDNIRIVGKPTFEDLVPMAAEATAIRAMVRHELRVEDDQFLYVHWSSGSHPVADVRSQIAVLRALGRIGPKAAVFAPRLHPKLGSDAIREELWGYATSGTVKAVDARKVKAEHLSIAADAVVSAWNGTEGYRAMLLERPVVVPQFPDDLVMRVAAGFPDGIPPILKGRAAYAARNADELADRLDAIARHPDDASAFTSMGRNAFKGLMSPGAAYRILREITRIVD